MKSLSASARSGVLARNRNCATCTRAPANPASGSSPGASHSAGSTRNIWHCRSRRSRKGCCRFLPLSPCGRGCLRCEASRAGERLSEESSCIGVLGTRIACFCVEADEQFMGESNPDGHFVFSCGEQSFSESRKGLVVLSGGPGDQEKDRSDAGAAPAARSFSPALIPLV